MAARDPDDFVREVTRRIGVARRALGLTQEAAALRYGTALKNWQRFEAGQNLTLHTLARIARTIGTTPEQLVKGGPKDSESTGKAPKLPAARVKQAPAQRGKQIRGARKKTASKRGTKPASKKRWPLAAN